MSVYVCVCVSACARTRVRVCVCVFVCVGGWVYLHAFVDAIVRTCVHAIFKISFIGYMKNRIFPFAD